jgi:hypothetical protein
MTGRGARSTEVVPQTNTARHALPQQARTMVFPRPIQAVSAMRQRVAETSRPPRPRELAGAVLALDRSVWRMMISAAQTPAFGFALMFGLVLTWLGALTPSYLNPAQSPALTPHRSMLHNPALPIPPNGNAGPRSDAIPPMDDAAPPDADIDPIAFAKLQTVLAELDHNAARSGPRPLLPALPPPSRPPSPGRSSAFGGGGLGSSGGERR